MSIKVDLKAKKLGGIDITLKREKHPSVTVSIPFDLKMKRTMDGEIIVLDHPEIDISVLPKQMKIVVFPKEYLDTESYGYADDLFRFLHKKRVIKTETIKAGSVYGSLEASIRETVTDDADPLQLTILAIAQYIKKEREFFDYTSEVKKEMEKRLFEPSPQESTELGEVPHATAKGSIVPGMVRRYGQGYYYIYEGKKRG
tara:strand:- start:1657 stop:2256 length:600 start_codon:yes stop_codon:yes gene_type:complete